MIPHGVGFKAPKLFRSSASASDYETKVSKTMLETHKWCQPLRCRFRGSISKRNYCTYFHRSRIQSSGYENSKGWTYVFEYYLLPVSHCRMVSIQSYWNFCDEETENYFENLFYFFVVDLIDS